MNYYAYESRYGWECIGDGTPHRFASRRDRDRWINEDRDHRNKLKKSQFERKAIEFGWYVEHENGEMYGYEMEVVS